MVPMLINVFCPRDFHTYKFGFQILNVSGKEVLFPNGCEYIQAHNPICQNCFRITADKVSELYSKKETAPDPLSTGLESASRFLQD